jgi:hypothetical protein
MALEEIRFLVSVVHQGIQGENMFAVLALVDEQDTALQIARKFDLSDGPYIMKTTDQGVFVRRLVEGKLYSNRDPSMPFFEKRFDPETKRMVERTFSP